MAPSNGFIPYVLEQQRREQDWQDKTLPELVELCSPLWQNLSVEEKTRFCPRKKAYAPQSDGRDSYGRVIKDVLALKARQLKEPELMNIKIRDTYETKELSRTVFTFIHANIFLKTDEGEYLPAEICVANFTLQDGIIQVYHDFPDPGVIPRGYKYECQITSDRTHKIPMDLMYMNPNHHSILDSIDSFIQDQGTGGGERLVFSLGPNREQSQEVLNMLYRSAAKSKQIDMDPEVLNQLVYPATVLDISYLLRILLDISQDGINHRSIMSLELQLSSGQYIWGGTGMGCQFHEEIIDNRAYCSKAVVTDWIYNFCEYLCPLHNIPLLPGKHLPAQELPGFNERDAGSNNSELGKHSEVDSYVSSRRYYGSEFTEDRQTVTTEEGRESNLSMKRCMDRIRTFRLNNAASQIRKENGEKEKEPEKKEVDAKDIKEDKCKVDMLLSKMDNMMQGRYEDAVVKVVEREEELDGRAYKMELFLNKLRHEDDHGSSISEVKSTASYSGSDLTDLSQKRYAGAQSSDGVTGDANGDAKEMKAGPVSQSSITQGDGSQVSEAISLPPKIKLTREAIVKRLLERQIKLQTKA